MTDFVLRSPVPDDLPFIHSAWLRGQSETQPWNFIPRALFVERQIRHINYCLAHHETLVLCFPEDPSELIGFISFSRIAETPVVHWAYLKAMHRRRGLGRRLFIELFGPEALSRPVVATSWSRHCDWLRRRLELVWDPYSWSGA